MERLERAQARRAAAGRAAYGVLALGLLALLLARPGESIRGIEEGLRCCAGQIIPALFPFFVVTNLIASGPAARLLGRVLRPVARLLGFEGDGAATALLLSWLGGFAVAAGCIGQLYRARQLTKPEAECLLASAVGSGPAFVINTVGLLMLGSHQAGMLLLGALLLANLCCGLLLRPALRRQRGGNPARAGADAGRKSGFVARGKAAEQAETEAPPPPAARQTGLVAAVGQAVDSTLTVCGFVLFFRFLCVVLAGLLPQGGPAAFAVSALLEVTSGCAAAAALGAGRMYACCAALSLQSLSVLLQVRALLPAELSMRPLLRCRVVHLPLSLLFLRLGLRLWPDASAALSTLAPRVLARSRMPLDAALLLFFLCCAVLRCAGPAGQKETAAAPARRRGARPTK